MPTFFGVQIACAIPTAIRTDLSGIVATLRAGTDLMAVRNGWTRAADLLRSQADGIELGSWDLIREDAEETYEEWASGLEAMADWPLSDFGGGDLLLVTIIALISSDTPADRTLGDICDLPERDWHRRSTYQALLAAMPKLAMGDIRGTALYVAPRPDQGGFSRSVLTGDGFEYLEKIAR